MKIGVKYDKGHCGGTLYFEDAVGHTTKERFRCGADGHLSPTKQALPYPVQVELERHCWNNCRTARWARPGRKSSGAWGGCSCKRGRR
jgi:hypothetical protein